jgi:hypothetical protein
MTHLGPLTDRELNSILAQVRGKDPGLEHAVEAEIEHRKHLRSIATVAWWGQCAWKPLLLIAALAAGAWWWL